MSKYFLLFIIPFFLLKCNSFRFEKSQLIDTKKRDSLKNELQNSIVDFKKFTAVNFYYRLLDQSYENAGLEKVDDYSGTIILKYSKGFLFTQEYITDENREKLINSWLNKNYFDKYMLGADYDLMNEKDKKKITLDILKFIEFYQSSDLDQYMDSINEIELKKINKGSYDFK